MAEVEEPQFTSLQARIAALKQQGMGKSANGSSATFGKRAPPPLPTSSSTNAANRPSAPARVQTVNNPPIASYGSSVTKQANNLPNGAKGTAVLPPPPVDRDQPIRSNTQPAKSPSLPARNAPPPLPGRNASQPSLPPRNGSTSTQMVRRGSNSSTLSYSSTMSGLSLTKTGSSTKSASSVDTQRKLPPALSDAKLPPLPPTRKEREERVKDIKIPLVTVKSAPVIPIRSPPVVERDLAPRMPQRPKIPSRPTSRNNMKEEEQPLPQPPREMPPPAAATRSVLSMGFGNKPKQSNETPTPTPGPRPVPSYTKLAVPAVQELTPSTYDRAIEGKFALIDFYAPYCKYCVELEPAFKQLGEDLAFASDKLVIAKVDVDAHESFMSRYDIQGYPTILFFDGRSDVPEKYPYQREFGPMTKFLEEKTGISVADGARTLKSNGVPPPINMSSKPSRSQVQAIKSRPAPTAPPPSGCMLCRDFSGPDGVAAQYPRQSLPRTHDISGYLADVLCTPFTSATDKARAIFTWLHHNIAYDTAAFFGNNVKHVEPKDTISSGLAVCAGYAGVFSAIALKAGLEAVMVTGHGKGYGHTPLQPGEPIPTYKSNHAWNAVRIDNGEWKLVDACWGAGNVGNESYTKHFTPSCFTMSNDQFGLKHFPENDKYFYRADGRPLSWEKYILGATRTEPLEIADTVEQNLNFSPSSFSPVEKNIPVSTLPPNEIIRFQFSKICEHWDFEKHGKGKPYVMILKIGGVDGRKADHVSFETNGFWWWADVKAKDLGAPGSRVHLYNVETLNGKDGRGVKRAEFERVKGNFGGSFGGAAVWGLV